ncbi:hypothetical protein ACG7TL_002120 [Trametes sanguinea]
MQFKLTAFAALAATLAAIAPSSLAATCYSAGGCQECESRDSIASARQAFCGSSDWNHSNTLNWGWARITLNGRFATQQECYDGFENIIDQCYGKKDGGKYTYDYNGDSASLDVDFCECE